MSINCTHPACRNFFDCQLFTELDHSETERIVPFKEIYATQRIVKSTPTFNYVLDLWKFCKTGNNLAEALRQFNLRQRIDSDQGQWTLQS